MERECLAIVWAITDQFHCYVYGTTFTVRTDNRPLKWLQTLRKPTPRIARWILKLQEYDYEIVHRSGSSNRVADALSRIPTNAVFFHNDKSIKELIECQRTDPDLMQLIECLASGNEFDNQNDFGSKCRQLFRRIEEFDLDNDVLVCQTYNKGRKQEQVVVPPSLQPEILRAFHDDPTGGHLSRDKMLGKIRERYFWLGLTDNVKRHCNCCLECQN